MKTMKKVFAILFVCVLLLSCIPGAMAASVPDATIDTSRTGSLSIYKYDLTRASTDDAAKVMFESYVSTGVKDEALEAVMNNGTTNNLGNGETSNGYAVKGVEFSYLKVAEIVTYDETEDSGTHKDMVLYKFDDAKSDALLTAIGLSNSDAYSVTGAYAQEGYHFFESDTLVDALYAALEANSTAVKNALETYMTAQGAAKFDETDSDGHTYKDELELGLYLIVESKVPEMVTSTVNPFFVSLPMTSVNGSNASNGGEEWLYDLTIYPKNETGIPTLEKTVRESVNDTGKHGGSDTITDGYAHTGTASDGDVIDYQLISTLPSITSEATYLTEYTFVDTLSKGLSYNKDDVKLQFFTDAACTDLITTWTQSDDKFTVSYSTTAENESVMTIEMTEAGLREINTSKAVYSDADAVHSGYSDCTLRITYQATVNSDASVVYGDADNPNEVMLAWKRSSQDYYDTLIDDAHVYTYALALTKLFSDGKGNLENVEFLIHNDTDGYFVKAELNKAEGVYYVVDHVTDEAEATHFIPVESNGNPGKVIVKGLEDDTYTVTEVHTDSGYTLLRDDIVIVISQEESTALCDIYASDTLGLLQNDPRYASIVKSGMVLPNMPQKHLEHHLLTASATVDDDAVTMTADGDSANAIVPLTVVNTRGFDVPKTGDNSAWMFGLWGGLLAASAIGAIILLYNKKYFTR